MYPILTEKVLIHSLQEQTGSLSIGSLSIGSLSIGSLSIGSLLIDSLTHGSIEVPPVLICTV